jgi:hypothetical protein
MRLINTHTLQLQEFLSGSTPQYAILSHTWEAEEVSFEEWKETRANAQSEKARDVMKKRGYTKIAKFCGLCQEGIPICRHQVCISREDCVSSDPGSMCCSRSDEDCQCESTIFEWLWVDTCSIDKSSSTELSEAINSMFRWYRDAAVCVVYLCDVPSEEDVASKSSRFRVSRWFSRGWTLQELIAPTSGGTVFYSQHWAFLGSTRLSRRAIRIPAVMHGDVQEASQANLDTQAHLGECLTKAELSEIQTQSRSEEGSTQENVNLAQGQDLSQEGPIYAESADDQIQTEQSAGEALPENSTDQSSPKHKPNHKKEESNEDQSHDETVNEENQVDDNNESTRVESETHPATKTPGSRVSNRLSALFHRRKPLRGKFQTQTSFKNRSDQDSESRDSGMPPLGLEQHGLPTSGVSSVNETPETTPAQESDLPPGWEQRNNAAGQPYFVNHNTHTTTWWHPKSDLPPGWVQGQNAAGQRYFQNHNTGKTTWLHPKFLPQVQKYRQRFWLCDVVSEITGIPRELFESSTHTRSYLSYSVSKRMSWAASRQTTRPEDIAYCLLGLFDVNMPLIYGEGGRKAFFRLQEQILGQTTDHSLFAWRLPASSTSNSMLLGVFADEPSRFRNFGHFHTRSAKTGLPKPLGACFEAMERSPCFLMTDSVQMRTMVLPLKGPPGCHLAFLDCVDGNHPDELIALNVSRSSNGRWIRLDKISRISAREIARVLPINKQQNLPELKDILIRAKW